MINRKGLLAVEIVFLSLFGCAIISAIIMRPAHIIKRANQKCQADGGDRIVCKDKVNSWTQEERIEYIRDK